MFNFLKYFFPRIITQPDWDALFKAGAVLIDVRDERLFNAKHASGSINIPLKKIENHIDELKRLNKPIILVCGSGLNSATAKEILMDHDIEDIYTGGMWFNFQFKDS